MRSLDRRGGPAGFTLLELLISVVLLITIAAVAGGAMRLAHRSVTGGEKKIERLERLAKSIAIINEQLQSAIPLTFDADGTKHFYFEGHEDSVKVPTSYSIWRGRSGYVIVEYRVRTDSGGTQSLWADEYIVGTEKRRETMMLRGLKSIHFEYFQKDPTKEEGDWVREWPEPTKTPEKMRIEIVSDKRDILLLVPLRVRGDIGLPNTSDPSSHHLALSVSQKEARVQKG